MSLNCHHHSIYLINYFIFNFVFTCRPFEESSPSRTPPSYSRVALQQQSNTNNSSSDNIGILSVGSAGAPSPMMNTNSVPGIANPSPLDGTAGASTPRPPSSVPPCDALMPVLSPQQTSSSAEKSNDTPTGPCATEVGVVSTPETSEQTDVLNTAISSDANQSAVGGPKSVSSVSGNLVSYLAILKIIIVINSLYVMYFLCL